MKPKRNWMRFTLDRAQDPGDRFVTTNVILSHAPALARLMDAAYTGTIDHEGETPEQCLAEMRGTIEGKYGQLIKEASFVSLDGDTGASASLITLWKGHPLLAFSMTAPEFQSRGMAGFLIQKSLLALKNAGYKVLYLVVTDGNTPAERLYRKLGFATLGEAIPGRGVDESLTLERVDLSAEALVQEILNAAPTYSLKVDGLKSIPGDARDTLTDPPPNCTMDQKHVLVLRDGGKAVGVADVVQGFPDSDTAFLGLLLLREDHQRKGMGKSFYRMIEAMVAEKFGCRKIRLAVVDSNPVGPFWEKMGFVLTGDVRPHEGKRLKSVKRVMEKVLG